MQPFKRTLVLKIPPESVLFSINAWSSSSYQQRSERYRHDDNNIESIQSKVNQFVKAILKEHHLTLNSQIYVWLNETAANAFDAHKQKAVLGQPLLLKMVIKADYQKLSINIMDNGTGFTQQPKSIYFTYNDIHEPKKDPHKAIGGLGIGLKNLDIRVSHAHGTLFFKNRKDQGATVSLQFPLSDLGHSHPENSEQVNNDRCTIS